MLARNGQGTGRGRTNSGSRGSDAGSPLAKSVKNPGAELVMDFKARRGQGL